MYLVWYVYGMPAMMLFILKGGAYKCRLVVLIAHSFPTLSPKP